MYSKTISLENLSHSYSVPEFIQLACSFQCSLKLRNNQGLFDAKSIMGMMTFNPKDGKVTVIGDGIDEEIGVKALLEFLSGNS